MRNDAILCVSVTCSAVLNPVTEPAQWCYNNQLFRYQDILFVWQSDTNLLGKLYAASFLCNIYSSINKLE